MGIRKIKGRLKRIRKNYITRMRKHLDRLEGIVSNYLINESKILSADSNYYSLLHNCSFHRTDTDFNKVYTGVINNDLENDSDIKKLIDRYNELQSIIDDSCNSNTAISIRDNYYNKTFLEESNLEDDELELENKIGDYFEKNSNYNKNDKTKS